MGISAKAQGGRNWRGGAGDPAQHGGVGAFIRDRRRAAGLTQVQLAEAAAVSVGMLRDLEQDRTACPRRAALQELYIALDLGPAPAGSGRGYGGEPGHIPGDGPLNGRAEHVVTGAEAGVRLCVLGPLGASRGGVPVQLGGARQRAVLGLLALHHNAVLHRDTIIETLWRDDPPPSAVKMVQAHIGHLRRQLDPGRQPQDRDGVLLSAGTHYRLQADATQLDLIAFEQLADRGHAVRQAGDAATACALYAEALSLWQGDPLADLDLLAGHPALFGLSRRRAAVVSDFAETATGAGWHDRVLPYLEALAERDPLDERIHGWLMLALAGTGQQAAALACYGALRRRLTGKLGVLPGPALVEAHARVLRQDVPAARAPVTVPRQLPRGPAGFVGRADECGALDFLARQVADGALICVIDGMAGVGKTALAVHAGRRLAGLFPDGQLYADLRGFGPRQPPVPPAEALACFLRALGAGPDAARTDVDELAAAFRSLLADRRMLIVLDNAASAGQVRPLFPGSPGSLILVTSRSRLPGLAARDGAERVTLPPLATAEAIGLLGMIVGRDRVATEQRAASAIAALCGHLPFALRIVAERAASCPRMPLADLADQLTAARARLDVLDLDGADGVTARAVFSWSYQALAPDSARMFRMLGLHAGPDVTVPAAAALAATPETQAARLLGLLANAHLIEEPLPGRFRLNDLLRAYAAELAGAGEVAAGGPLTRAGELDGARD